MNIDDPATSEGNTHSLERYIANEDEKEDEFSKPMMYLYDLEELKERKKEQMYGNMYLITELYIAK